MFALGDCALICFLCVLPGSVVLLLFAACSLLLCVCRIGYQISMMGCRPVQLLAAFTEAPFLTLQVNLFITAQMPKELTPQPELSI